MTANRNITMMIIYHDHDWPIEKFLDYGAPQGVWEWKNITSLAKDMGIAPLEKYIIRRLARRLKEITPIISRSSGGKLLYLCPPVKPMI